MVYPYGYFYPENQKTERTHINFNTRKKIHNRAYYQTIETSTFLKIILGVAAIGCAVLLICMASQGKTVEDRDATGALFLLPIGIGILCSIKKNKKVNN